MIGDSFMFGWLTFSLWGSFFREEQLIK